MAVTPLILLTVCVCGVASLCNVTCWTDYRSVLNCSCAAEAAPARPVLVHLVCSDEDLNMTESCEVTPPLSWCAVYPKMLEEDASTDTICTATVRHHGDPGGGVSASESSTWELSHMVRAQPPTRVHVTDSAGFYNITWVGQNPKDCLEYRLRIRERHAPRREPLYTLLVAQNHLALDHRKLPPLASLAADVQAKMCQDNLYKGPWSEWSDAAEWATTGQDSSWYYSFLSIPLVAVLLLLIWSHKTFLQRKIQLVGVYPRPQHFFAPLYADYEGNFKEWVKPAFSEYDFIRPTLGNMEKQYSVLQRSGEGDAGEGGGAGLSLLLQPDANPPPPLFQDGGVWQATAHSAGHVSIHTVKLSGEEESEEEVMSRRSINTLSSYGGDGEEASDSEAELSDPGQDVGPPPAEAEAERVSLASFASNSQSEDGYPHMDLDTIDSGFSECGSPAAAEYYQKHGNSNYVKQWPAPEDGEGHAQEVQ